VSKNLEYLGNSRTIPGIRRQNTHYSWMTAIQDRKHLAATRQLLRKICLRGAFGLEVRRKPQAFAAVAMMQVGIMEIECRFVIRLMLLGPAIVVDADGRR
jgi:hypothetical protein